MKLTTLFIVVCALSLVGCASGYEGLREIEALFTGSLSDNLQALLVAKVQAHPQYALFVGALSAAMPVIGWVANYTSNPIDNAFLIALNKVLQTLVTNSSRNQPDVLSWRAMFTNKPSQWPALLKQQMAREGFDLMVAYKNAGPSGG